MGGVPLLAANQFDISHFLALMILFSCCLPHTIAVAATTYTVRSSSTHGKSLSSLKKLQLPPNVTGPESLAFDLNGVGPYTGVADGRILKYTPAAGFVDFAITSPNRTKELCDGVSTLDLGATCGRPLGLGFNYRTGYLYIADIFKGLLVVGPNGGLATQLTSSIQGTPFGFPNAVDLDPFTGVVYFTDCGSIFKRHNITEVILSGDRHGKLLKYDPRTKRITRLLTGLSGANGVAVSKDGSFVLVSEYIGRKIRRYWLKGPKANMSDVFMKLEGCPDNIKRTRRGDFLVPMEILRMRPNKTKLEPVGLKISPDGKLLKRIRFSEYDELQYISEIQEHGVKSFIGSPTGIFVGLYPKGP